MAANSAEAMELLKKKHALLKEILRMTESVVFSGNAANMNAEAEAFIELYEQRDSLVAELLGTSEKLSGLAKSEIVPEGTEADRLSAEVETLLASIVEMDKRNQSVGNTLFNGIKNSIKRINQGRNVSLLYTDQTTGGGYMVDKEN